jgi:tetratricopeptide (TPR) repeat protein
MIFGQKTLSLFQEANKAYEANNFEKAASIYEQVLASGWRSPALHYNLANAYYRLNKVGKSILHYERALLLDPNDRDIRYNLSLVRENLPDDIESLPTFFLARWWNALRSLLSSGAWGWLALAMWWTGFGGFCVWLAGNTREVIKRGFIAGAFFLTLSLLPFSLALSRANYETATRQAVILVKTTALKSAPDDAGKEIQTLHEGTKVWLLEKLSGYWKIRLPNGETGWLHENDIGQI